MLSFNQFVFSPVQNFQPSIYTKNFWLYTQKNRSNFAGVQLPGLFATEGYSIQIAAFIGILLLEGIPTFYGMNKGVKGEGIIGAIFIDIALAILSHLWHKQICLNENKLVTVQNPVIQVQLQRKITTAKVKTYFFYILIGFSVFFKFFIFKNVFREWNTTTIAVLVAYTLGGILHIFFTGYFFFTSRFNFKIKKDNDVFINSGGKTFEITDFLEQPIITDGMNLSLLPTSAGKHSIIKVDDNSYAFKTWGILNDNELASLINVQQSPITQSIIAREGVKHQLLILTMGVNMGTNVIPTNPVNNYTNN